MKTETAPLKSGKIILRNNALFSPKVESIALVRVTRETLAEIRLINFAEEYK